MTDETTRQDTGTLAETDIDAVIADILTRVAAARRGRQPGDEFSVITRLGELGDIPDDQFQALLERVDRAVAPHGVMVEALHDVKCDFVVFR